MPVTALVIGGAVQGGAKIAQGIKQKKMAKRLKESTYIPPALLEAESKARKEANATRYAGQEVDEANIAQASATAVSNVNKAATNSADALNMGAAIVGSEQKQKMQLGKILQQSKIRGKEIQRETLYKKAQAQARNRAAYEAAKSALTGASIQNTYSGVSDIGGAAAAFGSANFLGGGNKATLDKINQGGWG
jgi:hypothetical protein